MTKTLKNKSWFKKWGLVIILSLSLVIMILDTTMINVSIRDVVTDLDTDLKSVQWAITIYSLMMAAFMLIGGKIGDLYGRKRAFVAGALIYGVGTLTAALSPNVATLIIGWSVIEGIGAALMMPATVSLMMANYQGGDRKIAFGIWGGMAGAAGAIGPLFGGFMTTYYSWRLAFGLEIILVAAIVGLSFLIKDSRKEKRETIDFLGMALSAVGFASMVYGFIEASEYGWWQAKKIYEIFGLKIDVWGLSITPVAVFVGLLFVTVFIWWQSRVEKDQILTQSGKEKVPLLSPSLFKNKEYASGISIVTLIALSQAGIFFTVPVFLQLVGGYNAFDTGITLIPMSVTLFLASGIFAKLSKKIPAKYIIQFGVIILFISTWVLRDAMSVEFSKFNLQLSLALFGFGFGSIMSQLTNTTLSTVDVKKSGEASGLMTTIRNLGGSLGTAIVGTIMISTLITSMTDLVNANDKLPEPAKAGIIKELDENGQQLDRASVAEENDPQKAMLGQELNNIKNQATVDANREALKYAAYFTVLVFMATFLLPKKKGGSEPPMIMADQKE